MTMGGGVRRRSAGRFVVGLVWATMGGCHRIPDPAFKQLSDARALAAELRVQFGKAVGASDRAVLADTDETSLDFARQAESATHAVEGDAAELSRRFEGLGFDREKQLLDDFSGRFAAYRKVDRETLALAVENTNLKAQRLSFGPIRQASDAFRGALDAMARAVSGKDHCRAAELVAKAELALLEIQVLQAPHIAEPDDVAMSRLEKTMAELLGTATGALSSLRALVAPTAQSTLAAANQALTQFQGLSGQLIALSRANSNVRSLSLALNQKPKLTSACDGSLTALENALSKEGPSATR
jgi:methyl-accepting chemotaxis protein